jgi:glycosyltransferase involved in cell wall biosynthesis
MLYNTFFLKCGTSLKALKQVAAALPSMRLICFGAEHPDFRLPLPRFAEFHYRPPQEKIKELYAQCDVWLCGSNVEGFHLPPLEAMACRCPVVSTRVGGPMDIIDEGVNGHLVDVKDVNALADRTLRVLLTARSGNRCRIQPTARRPALPGMMQRTCLSRHWTCRKRNGAASCIALIYCTNQITPSNLVSADG